MGFMIQWYSGSGSAHFVVDVSRRIDLAIRPTSTLTRVGNIHPIPVVAVTVVVFAVVEADEEDEILKIEATAVGVGLTQLDQIDDILRADIDPASSIEVGLEETFNVPLIECGDRGWRSLPSDQGLHVRGLNTSPLAST